MKKSYFGSFRGLAIRRVIVTTTILKVCRSVCINRIRGKHQPSQVVSSGFGGVLEESSIRRYLDFMQAQVFKINYVLLSYSLVNNGIYHILMLFEFFQMFFLANYGWVNKNGFSELQLSTINVEGYVPKLISQRTNVLNRTAEVESLTAFLQFAQTTEIRDPEWRMDEQVKFANPILYILSGGKKEVYIVAYWVMTILFYAFTLALALFRSALYNRMMNSAVTESFKLLIKSLQFVMILFMTVLQIPIFTLLLQAFNCEEDVLVDYTLINLDCNGQERQIIVPVSIVTLSCYLVVFSLQTSLFQQTKLDSTLPWAGHARQTTFLRAVIKLALAAGFIFDKGVNYRPIVMYLCTAIFLYILYRRFVDANYFNRGVNFAINTYDIIIAYHLAFVATHIVDNYRYGVPNAVVFLFSSILFALLFETLLHCKNLRVLVFKSYLMKASSVECEVFMQKYFQKVERAEVADQFFFFGSLFQHLEECFNFNCECRKIASIVEGLNRFEHFKKRLAMASDGEQLEKGKSLKENQDEVKVAEEQEDNKEKLHISLEIPKKWYEVRSSTKECKYGPQGTQSVHKIERDSREDERALEIYELVFGHPIEQETFQKNSNGGYEIEIEQKNNIKKQGFKFIAVLLTQIVQRFPKEACHRMQLASLYKSQLNKQFKAIYELLSCKQLDLSFYEKFVHFQRMGEIEQELWVQHLRQIEKQNYLDVTRLFDYNRAFLEFQSNELQATSAALKFWRELLSKDFNAESLQGYGQVISRCVGKINDAAQQITRLYPEDIKFHFHYGMFLIKIINNDFDGTEYFKMAQFIFASKVDKKGEQRAESKQSTRFIDNSGSGFVVLSTESKSFCRVIHANDEIEVMFGYKRKELLDKSVNQMMPPIIGQFHDGFVKKYFSSGKIDWQDKIRSTFGKTKEGSIFRVDILIKIYPKVSGQITLIGVFQRSTPMQTLNTQESLMGLDPIIHFLITDNKGFISNVSAGLLQALGLHPKFFNYSHDSYLSMIRLDQIAQYVLDSSVQDYIETDGAIVNFDTTELLINMETEKLTHEDLEAIRPQLKKQDFFMKMQKLALSNSDYACVFFLQIVRFHGSGAIASSNAKKAGQLSNSDSKLKAESSENYTHVSSDANNTASMSSVSSASSSANTFSSMVRDFKKTLSDRRMPRNLLILNRLVIFIILAAIILQIVYFVEIQNNASKLEDISVTALAVNKRNIAMASLNVCSNTLVGVPNEIVTNVFSLDILNTVINRADNLLMLLETYLKEVQDSHNIINKLRNIDTEEEFYRKQSSFEYSELDVLIVDDKNFLIKYPQPYKVALQAYLGDIAKLPILNNKDLFLPIDYISTPFVPDPTSPSSPTTPAQKLTVYMFANGLRILRYFTDQAADYFNNMASITAYNVTVLVIMMVSVMITLASVSIIFYQIWQIEHIQGEILSLYAYLSKDHINDTYQKALGFMREIAEGSFIKQISPVAKDEFSRTVESLGMKIESSLLVSNEYGAKARGKESTLYTVMMKRITQEIKDMFSTKDFTVKNIEEERKYPDDREDEINGMPRRSSKNEKRFKGKELSIQEKISKEFLPRFKQNKGKRKVVRGKMALDSIDNPMKNTLGETNRALFQNRQGTTKETGLKDIDDNESSRSAKQSEDLSHSEDHHEQHMRVPAKEAVVLVSVSEIEERKLQFKRTLKSKNARTKLSVLLVGVIIGLYFVLMYFLQQKQVDDLSYLQQKVPIFLNRLRFLTLGFGISRERVFQNNSLDCFENDEVYGHDIDVKHIDLSVANEFQLINMKSNFKSVLQPLVDQLNVLDSPDYCDSVIKNSLNTVEELLSSSRNVKVHAVQTDDYTSIIITILKACNYARLGNYTELQKMRSDDTVTSFEYGDYDFQRPLHHATKNEHVEIVLYLLDNQKVFVNPLDRWGKTPLDYLSKGSTLEGLLVQRGGQRTQSIPIELGPVSGVTANLTNDQARLFLASYYGNLGTVQILHALGVGLDVKDHNGRTPLHIAAAEGNFEVIKYLIAMDVKVQVYDNQGIEARIEANKLANKDSYNLLNNVISNTIIKDYCKEFSNGIYKNGMAQAVGAYHKKFSDLQIMINSTNSYLRRTTLVYGERFNAYNILKPEEVFQTRAIPEFLQGSELYFNRVLSTLLNKIQATYDKCYSQYRLLMLVLFFAFLAVLVLAMTLMRRKMINMMRDDIFKSRGILNLIPNSFFEQNKSIVEGIMKKLKY